MLRLSDILEGIAGLTLVGDPDVEIEGLNLCNRKTEKNSIMSYTVSGNYVEQIRNNPAVKALIVQENVCVYEELLLERGGCIVYTQFPEKLFYTIHEALCRKGNFYSHYQFPSVIGSGCRIHPSAVIEEGVIIGDDVVIGPMTVVRAGTVIGNGTTIGCNSVIGSEGFQLIVLDDGSTMHITHVGGVNIGKNVYIGDVTCVANSLFEGKTQVGDGAKIDNLVHIGHNCSVGRNAVLTAGTILCGSSNLEDGAWIGVNSSILNKVTVGKNAMVGIGSVVTRSVSDGAVAYGVPAKEKNSRH